ncbi:hypothetical protein BQ8794_20008 [Mesorhizobium prunaredense]|uniref:Uncharacterized protein n=1 Tax=Mesorhizobium prunaredense TaxID=1631249 RepID=A0A1R3V4Y4_9HYPH|nr:hypothetical protein BQ8794_20008 [Mesorhizobium prunaredense]
MARLSGDGEGPALYEAPSPAASRPPLPRFAAGEEPRLRVRGRCKPRLSRIIVSRLALSKRLF